MSFHKVRLIIVCSLAFQWTDFRVVAKHRSCSIFPCNVELKPSVTSYSIVLDTSSSTPQRCSSNSILLLNSVSESAQFFCSNSISKSAQCCSESAQLRQWVSSILQRDCSTLQWACWTPSAGPVIFAYLLCEKSLLSVGSFICLLREGFRYFVLCALFKNVLCILY